MLNQSLDRALLAVLLATAFSGAAQAQIALHATGRQITAHTSIHSGQEPIVYSADDSDGSGTDGPFTNSFTEGAALQYCQVQATISQQTGLTMTSDHVRFGGTLHVNTSLAEELDANGAGGSDISGRAMLFQ